MEIRENGLRQIRLQCNLSQGYLADKLMVSRQTISEWEKGKKRIHPGRKKELSEYFGVDEIFLSELSVELKKELLVLPLYWYKDGNKDYFLYKDQNSLGIIYFGERTETLDEEYAKLKKEITKRFGKIKDVYSIYDICIRDKISRCRQIIQLLDELLADLKL